jgi:alginate O-acetyltransferase complex protein AlgI
MLFNSLGFLYVFLPIAYFIYRLLTRKTQRYVWLTLTGYVFYGFWNYKFCFLMLFSTLVSYFAGLGFLRWKDDARMRKLCLVVPVTADLLLLGFFKYFNFTLDTLGLLSSWLGIVARPPHLDIILPVGISFYTFHTISYIVDSYRRTVTPTRNFFEFACYVSLFSQLVAGPIVRFAQVERDLDEIDKYRSTKHLSLAWSFFCIGLIKKVLLADSLALIINPALKDYASLSTVDAWLCMLGYSYQIYFDFSGYSDMAVGLGHLFNIRIPQNFNSPYKAVDIADFWRRWHISLSSCLRDYLYIPLGGNRYGEAMAYRNLMLTMILGGLWHGAKWTFVIWGIYHGGLLAIHRAMKDSTFEVPVLVRRAWTFFLVLIGWVFFRADDLTMATQILKTMFGFVSGPIGRTIPAQSGLIAGLLIAALVAHVARNTFEVTHDWHPAAAAGIVTLFVVSMLVITSGHPSPFLYFQF